MATNLTGLKVKDTYNSLLKIGDNSSLSATPDKISDGLGNESILYLSTSQVSIGTIPATGYDLTVNSATKTGSLDVVGAATAASLRLTGGSGSQGTLSWNTDEETVDIIQNGAVLQLGQEIHVHVKNQTGSTINDGTPVYVTGTLGSSGRLTVAPMIADGSIEAKYFLGVTTEDIPNGEDGKVTTFGKIRGLDTTAYTEGQTLYVSASTAGYWQTTAPVAPNLDLEAAIVINVSANNGTIFVRAQQGHYLGMLHDVYISSPANNQFLVYNSTTSRWENQAISSVGSINLDSVTDNGNTTTNNISVGDITAGNMTLSGYLRGAANFVIDPAAYGDETGVVQILGDLRVDGTTTTINSTTVTIDDKNIVLASGSATAADANGAGLTIDGASATMTYNSTSDRFVFNKDIETDLIGDVTGNLTGNVTGSASLNVLKAGDTMTGNLDFNDSVRARFGDADDFSIYHNGTNTLIDNLTGSLIIRNQANNQDIVLSSDDGSGGLDDYIRIDGSEGSVILYHYGDQKLTTTSTGVSVTGALSGNISTSSISGGTIDINGTTAINLQYNGSTQLRIDTFGVAYLGTVTFANDGISLTDDNSTIDSFFHANVAYDAGLYQILSNARYGADYIQVDGNDTRGNTVFAISPKDSTTTNPDLFLGGNNSVTSPNTLTDWRNIKMNATSVKINGNEVATRTWVTSNFTLDLDDVTTNGATTTNSITVGGLDTGGTVKTKSLLIDSGGSNSDIGEKFVYRISNTSSAGTTWRKVCEVSLPTGTYVALSMDIKFCYPSSNYGSSAQQKIWYYTASFRRSSGTQDDLNDALLYGYSINYVRIVKTATGEYELQARGNSNNVGFIVEYTVTAGNPNNITPTDGSVNGNTTGTIYIASTNDGNGIYGAGFIAARKFVKEGGSSSEFLKADGSVDSNTYLTSYTETDTLATVTGRGASTTSPITITSDSNLLNLRSSTNGNGAKINFSDQSSASYVQNGTLRYVHVDTASYGSGNAFIFESTEPSLTVLADGKLMYAEGIYSKPASGTGAGTRKDANWDSAYTFTSTFDITDYTDAKYLRSDANDETTGYLRVTGTYTNTSGVILGTFDGSTASSNAFTAAGIILGGGGKTGWGDGDVHGAIRWYNTDGSGIGARDAAKILAINTVGNGTSTTTFNGELAFYTSAYNATATEKVRIDDAGNLGVNTETPLHKLQIVGDGQFGESATVSEDSRVRIRTSSDGFIGMVRTGIRTWAHKIDAGGHYYIRNVDASYNTLTLTDTNRVGIGITEPSGMLHVSDQASTVTLMLGRASGTATIKSDGTADGHMIIDSGTNGTAVWLQNYTSGNVYLATGGGSVGIGTTSLSYKLDVAGTARIQSNAQINGDLTVLGSTNGVYVNSSGHASVRIDRGSTSYDNNLLFYTAGALDFRIWQDGSSDYLYVRDETGGGGNMVTFRKGGNVGIGVVPTEKLHVEGKITTSGRNYSYGQENFHIRMTEDSAVYGYMGNVNGSIYFANGSYYGSQIYNVTSGQTGLTTVYLGEGTFEIRNATFASGSSTASTSRRVLMDTLGNIGLNRDSCEAKLDVNGAILARGGSYSASIDSVSNASLVVEKGDIIYMTDGTYIRQLIQYNTSSTIVIGQTGTSLIADVEIRTGSSGNFKVFTNGGETMRMDSTAKLHVENDIIAFSTTVSDARLKNDVVTIDNALDKIKALRGVEYFWNKGGREGQKDLGFIAQEVEQVIPEIVRENEMPLLDDSGEKYKTVDYEKIVAVLVEAIKEQQKQIDELKARLDA